MKIAKTKYFNYNLLIPFLLSIFFFTSCEKEKLVFPFEDIETLDCRNLIVNKIQLMDSTVQIEIENTCNNCDAIDNVYLRILILDKISAAIDTIGITCECNRLPSNNSTRTYTVNTDYNTLPETGNIQVDFDTYCVDMYIRN